MTAHELAKALLSCEDHEVKYLSVADYNDFFEINTITEGYDKENNPIILLTEY
jgi:hypothetical protein